MSINQSQVKERTARRIIIVSLEKRSSPPRKVFLSLLVLSLTLATCYGACGYYPFEAKLKDGKLVKPTGCFDPFDKSKHSFGSTWNSSHCLQCSCAETGMECCSRYGGTAQKEGCTAMVNPETCEYEFYKLDDPSKPCV